MTNRDYHVMKFLYSKPQSLYTISKKYHITEDYLEKMGSSDFLEGTTLSINQLDFMASEVRLTPKGVELVEHEQHTRAIRWFDRVFGFVSGIAVAALGCWLTVIIEKL